MTKKLRLDTRVHELGYADSRAKAQAMIMAGEVRVNGQVATKAGTRVQDSDQITVKAKSRYVSRGGEKLAGAIETFQYNPAGKVIADVGACTGGFTDYLLQNDAKKVYAIDVGYGQLAYKLRQDNRVIVLERTNARYLESLGELVDMIVIDASFISLKLIIPAARQWLKNNGDIIALIKPQFEAGKSEVGKGGIVRDRTTHQQVLTNLLYYFADSGLEIRGLTLSPIKGTDGNIEFFIWVSKSHHQQELVNIPTLVESTLSLIE